MGSGSEGEGGKSREGVESAGSSSLTISSTGGGEIGGSAEGSSTGFSTSGDCGIMGSGIADAEGLAEEGEEGGVVALENLLSYPPLATLRTCTTLAPVSLAIAALFGLG